MLVGCALSATSAHAQTPASIRVEVDKTRLSFVDTVVLKLFVAGSVDALQPPSLADFKVKSQGTERQLGGSRNSFAQVYSLRPKKPGTIVIGAATASLNGRVVAQSEPLTITVDGIDVPPPVSAEEALRVDNQKDDDAFLRWTTPRSTYYVGEPFPLVLTLWLRSDLNASAPEIVQAPKLDGLLVEDLKAEPTAGTEQRTLGRKTFIGYPLLTQLATPLKPGKTLIDAAVLSLDVARRSGLQATTVALVTPSFYIEVLEVPTEERPASFSPRNVGQFQMSSKLVDERGAEVTRTRTGQRLILRADVSGSGNLVALEAPRISFEGAPAGAYQVEPLSGTNADLIEKSVRGMSGARVFQWIVNVSQPGNLATPTLTLDTFDPISRAFITLRGGGRPLEVSGAALTPEADQASVLGEDVGPIIESASLGGTTGGGVARSPVYWGALALPLIGFVWVEARHRRSQNDRRNPGARAARGAGPNARKRLRAAEQALKDGLIKDFYGQLARTLTSYFEERANIPATGMTHHEVRQAARAAGYPADLADAWVVEMENCDFARFAPTGSASDKMREAAARVSSLIDSLEKVTPERRP